METWPIGVFTSLDAGLGVQLPVAQELGITTIQLHAPSQAHRTAQHAHQLLERTRAAGIEITAVFGGFMGESYADIPTVAQTVGLVPLATRAARLAELKQIADFARELGVRVVALHLGFVPEDPADPQYAAIVAVTQDLCNHCRANGQNVHLETGQETADALLRFLADVAADNLFINFDPANMILYGTGEPIAALRRLGRFVRSVHCKDARWAARPGQDWGVEVPLGQGEVGIENYLQTLADIGYTGPLTIEREIPQDPQKQKSEIGQAVQLLRNLKAKITIK